MHRLLKRQIRKCFGIDFQMDERMKKFLDSISQSYNHFDDSQELLQRTMAISNEELFDSNRRLVKESEKHGLLVNSLKESIREISPKQKVAADDLLKIADVLKSEIVKRKQVEIELKKAREIAEASLKSRETFFANMSHEIRTPMNGIIGISRLMSETELNEEQSKFQRIIQSSAEDLVVIINDILDITKMSSGNFSLEAIDFSLDQMLDDLFKLLGLKADEKGVYLKLNYDLGIAKAHNADPIRLKQILINLIGNAIKFTEKGGVELTVELEKKKINSDVIRFAIADTGIGIAPEKIKTIFNSFVQEDESTNRRFGGTGLGLTISKQLVENFNGNLLVESIKDKGATFYFSIEIPHGEVEKERGLLAEEEKDLKNIKILLVEDNEINVLVASKVLSKWNCQVEAVENGQLAIDELVENKHDIILMDMQMPVMDGLEATSFIREKLKIDVPIIGFTANAMQGEKENCLRAGMDDYVTKPFDPDELYRKIMLLAKL